MNDIDVTAKMDREQFEEISADLFTRLRTMLQELLHNACKLFFSKFKIKNK